MAILLGALASLLIGLSDFLGRYGTLRSNAVTATAGAMFGGTATAALLVVVVPSTFGVRDLGLGAASGLFIGVALALLYESMATSSAAIGAPIGALGASLIPLGWDVVRGNQPSGLAILGIAIAILAILTITYSPGVLGSVGRGVRLAAAGSVFFGISLILLGETADGSGAWGPLGQRAVAFSVLVVLALRRGVPLLPSGRLLWPMLLSGVFGASAITAYAIGAQIGSLGSVAVAASMFPAVSATLSAAFDGDTLRWWQALGIAGVILGISLMALA